MADYDATIDELLVLTDSSNVAMLYNVAGNDTLSLATDLVALAMSYQLALAEAVALSDAVEIATSLGVLSSDNVTVADSPLTELSVDPLFSTDVLAFGDSVVAGIVADRGDDNILAVNDVLAAGLWHDVVAFDAVTVTETWLVSTQYQRSEGDVLDVPDTIHTWMSLDGQLQADLQGRAMLNAILMSTETSLGVALVPPPRVVILPRTPPEVISHFIVNPNPRSNRGR
jgi:hypothetical protein